MSSGVYIRTKSPWSKGQTKETHEGIRRREEKHRRTVLGRTKETHESVRSQAEKMSGRTKETHESVRRQAESISKTMTGRTKENDEGYRRRGETMHQKYLRGEGRTIGTKWFDTAPELRAESYLKELKESYVKQLFIKGVGKVDFHLPERNYVLEIDGEYYHTRPGAPEKDHKRNSILMSLGYKVVRIWDWEVFLFKTSEEFRCRIFEREQIGCRKIKV